MSTCTCGERPHTARGERPHAARRQLSPTRYPTCRGWGRLPRTQTDRGVDGYQTCWDCGGTGVRSVEQGDDDGR